MNLKKNSTGSKLMIMVSGRIDTSTAPELQEYANSSLDGVTELVFDFKEVNYVSSAGLRVLLSLQKKMMKVGSMKLINVNEAVNDVFEVTGFDEILDYEKG